MSKLATLVLNQYRSATIEDLVRGLDTMCSPADSYGWSSSGIYFFWDPSTREVLYVGLAVDLLLRFRQHNNLASCPSNCCKWNRILEYFGDREKLGYSILVQSRFDQAISSGWESVNASQLESLTEEFGYLDTEEAKRVINSPIVRELRRAEGALLALYQQDYGHLPAWNRIAGSDTLYADFEMEGARALLAAATGIPSRFDPLIAKSTLVELDANPMWCGYEELLHAARILVRNGYSWDEAKQLVHDELDYLPKMEAEGYLSKSPIF